MSHKSDSIAAGLRIHRAEKNRLQKDVAEAIGVRQTTLSSWENQGGIGLEDAWAAADYYGCSLDELAGRPWPPETAQSGASLAAGQSKAPVFAPGA